MMARLWAQNEVSGWTQKGNNEAYLRVSQCVFLIAESPCRMCKRFRKKKKKEKRVFLIGRDTVSNQYPLDQR